MRRIMKILGIITVMALLLGGVVLPVAATPDVIVSIDAPDEAAPDSDFTANVSINEVVDFDACNYDVSFDASVLRLDNVTSGLLDSTTIPVSIYNEISSGTYRVVQNVDGTAGVSGSGHLAVLHFHVIGAEGTSSAISLSNGMLGNNLAQEIPATWTGDTVTVTDTTPPTVASTLPVADATDVAIDTTVSVTFNEAMDAATITTSSFTLDSVAGSVSYDSGTYTATFTPGASLSYSTTYTATLSTAITNASSIPLTSAYSWSFTTASPPEGVIVSIDAPATAAADSDFTANVSINEVVDFDACNYDVSFNASVLELTSVTSGLIDSTTIPISIYNEISSGTWTIVQNVEDYVGVSGSGYLAVLHFHVIGAEGTSSAISLSNGMLGNNLAEEIVATWVGDTVNVVALDTTPPTVSSVSPVADATGVARGTTVSVTFSEAMDESTITTSSFTLDSVSGSVSYDSGTYTATFTPGANLSYSATYTATLSTAITDAAGNPLASAYSWSFTIRRQPTGGGGGGGGGRDTTPPRISAISATNITETSADIGWKTNEKSDSQVEYWASPGILSPLDTQMVTNHLISLTDLTLGSTHHFRVMSSDGSDNLAVSDEHTFATLGAPATFATSALTISPAEVDIGETITISVLIANTGDAAGSYEVALNINGVVEATKDVTLNAGVSEEVTFTLAEDVAGTYTVGINGLTGTFVVKAPTAFTISALAISPAKVNIGETVTISALVTNMGDAAGSYEVALKINGVVEVTKDVTLNAGASEEVIFTLAEDVAATYTVDVNGLAGEFVVKAGLNWWLIGGTIGGVIIAGVITFLVVKKRRA